MIFIWLVLQIFAPIYWISDFLFADLEETRPNSVRMYRVLSRFTRIQNLILDLYGNPRPVLCHKNGIYEDRHREYGVLHVEFDLALIDFTVNRALAKAIWREITAYQQPRSLIRLRISQC